MNTKLNTALSAFSLVATLAFSAAGYAQSPSAPAPSITVRYSELDLLSDAGAHTLYERIQNAALHVCRQVAPLGIDNMRCRQTLIDSAVADVNAPALTALRAGGKSNQLSARR
jgi:UrcA family protein